MWSLGLLVLCGTKYFDQRSTGSNVGPSLDMGLDYHLFLVYYIAHVACQLYKQPTSPHGHLEGLK